MKKIIFFVTVLTTGLASALTITPDVVKVQHVNEDQCSNVVFDAGELCRVTNNETLYMGDGVTTGNVYIGGSDDFKFGKSSTSLGVDLLLEDFADFILKGPLDSEFAVSSAGQGIFLLTQSTGQASYWLKTKESEYGAIGDSGVLISSAAETNSSEVALAGFGPKASGVKETFFGSYTGVPAGIGMFGNPSKTSSPLLFGNSHQTDVWMMYQDGSEYGGSALIDGWFANRSIFVKDTSDGISTNDNNIAALTSTHIQFPRLSTGPSNPVPGMVYFDLDDDELKMYDGTAWYCNDARYAPIALTNDVATVSNDVTEVKGQVAEVSNDVTKVSNNLVTVSNDFRTLETSVASSSNVWNLAETAVQNTTTGDVDIVAVTDPETGDQAMTLTAPEIKLFASEDIELGDSILINNENVSIPNNVIIDGNIDGWDGQSTLIDFMVPDSTAATAPLNTGTADERYAPIALTNDVAIVSNDVTEVKGQVAEVSNDVVKIEGQVAEVSNTLAAVDSDYAMRIVDLENKTFARAIGTFGVSPYTVETGVQWTPALSASVTVNDDALSAIDLAVTEQGVGGVWSVDPAAASMSTNLSIRTDNSPGTVRYDVVMTSTAIGGYSLVSPSYDRVYVVEPIYTGAASSTTLDSAGVLALANKRVAREGDFSQSITMQAGEYGYLAFPADYSLVEIRDSNGFPQGWTSDTVSVARPSGTVSYTVLHTAQPMATSTTMTFTFDF